MRGRWLDLLAVVIVSAIGAACIGVLVMMLLTRV